MPKPGEWYVLEAGEGPPDDWPQDPAPVSPHGLDGLEPGPELPFVLSVIDIEKLSGRDRITVMRAHQRMASHHLAHMYAAMAAVYDFIQEMEEFSEDLELVHGAAAAEIRAALRLARRSADFELMVAQDRCHRLPRVWAALAAGEIDLWRALVLLKATTHLSETGARAVVDEIIEEAPRFTTGQLRARIKRLCVEADPDDAAERYERAVTYRRVVLEPTDDGTAHLLGLDLPPHLASAAVRRINRLARRLRVTGEDRTMDQLRADVFIDLLTGTSATEGSAGGGKADRAVVDIVVDLETLLGLAERAGEIPGYGPVIADIARHTIRDQTNAQWRYTVTDLDSGMPLAAGITRRRPTAGQRRRVEARNRICVFPGCRMPATGCDIDHRTPHAAGEPTTDPNLKPLCRPDHNTVRHRIGWTHQPLPNGDHLWTTLLGHTHTTSGRPP